MTQKQLAQLLHISDKAVSKWERGSGLPDISLLCELAGILNVSIENLLDQKSQSNNIKGDNMKNSKFYVCPTCGNILLSTGDATINCCGKTMTASEAKKATDNEKLTVEIIENDWYISSEHPMTKDDYISFIAFLSSGKMLIIKKYPEWNLQARFPKREHGKLFWYSEKDGLKYMLI